MSLSIRFNRGLFKSRVHDALFSAYRIGTFPDSNLALAAFLLTPGPARPIYWKATSYSTIASNTGATQRTMNNQAL